MIALIFHFIIKATSWAFDRAAFLNCFIHRKTTKALFYCWP